MEGNCVPQETDNSGDGLFYGGQVDTKIDGMTMMGQVHFFSINFVHAKVQFFFNDVNFTIGYPFITVASIMIGIYSIS